MKCDFLEGIWSCGISMLFCLVLVMPAMIVGCAEKEKVLDVETPAGEVEVERDVDTGDTEVDVTREATPQETQSTPTP